jgi:hypothetical protein
MITKIFKMSMYAIVLFFIFAGILSVKDKLIKNDSITTESFEEDEMIEDNTIDNEKKVEAGKDKTSNNEKKNTSPNDTTLNNSESNSTNKLIKVTTNSPDMKYCDPEIINDIKKNFSKKVDNMKNKLNDDISVFKRIIESDISEMFIVKTKNELPIKEGVDPVVMYKDDEDDEDDEDEDEITEKFTQEEYDGITSPYCLNCREF